MTDIALLIIGGLILLTLGGELVVRGAASAARRLGVSPVFIGVVLMGFGTSLPELVTSVDSVLADASPLAVGNIVGSNVANLLLIAGAAAVLTNATVSPVLLGRDGLVMLGATALFILLLLVDGLFWPAGLALLALLSAHLWIAVNDAASGRPEAMTLIDSGPDDGPLAQYGLWAPFAIFVLGLVATVLGADLLVDGAIQLARGFDLSEALIGATIVAVGTSLPELAATIAAALRGRGDMAMGNVFGSNIFNLLAIGGVAALVAPLDVPGEVTNFHAWAMAGATVLVLLMARVGGRMTRVEGAILLLCYVAYVTTAAVTAL